MGTLGGVFAPMDFGILATTEKDVKEDILKLADTSATDRISDWKHSRVKVPVTKLWTFAARP